MVEETVSDAGARRLDRSRFIEGSGMRIAVYEEGDERAGPLARPSGFRLRGHLRRLRPRLAEAGFRSPALYAGVR